jgi:hypothetical protein
MLSDRLASINYVHFIIYVRFSVSGLKIELGIHKYEVFRNIDYTTASVFLWLMLPTGQMAFICEE